MFLSGVLQYAVEQMLTNDALCFSSSSSLQGSYISVEEEEEEEEEDEEVEEET